MNRKKLLDTLELVRPALRDDNLVPIYTHLCFDGGAVYAHRDELTISTSCEVEETFAVNGKLFIEFLRNINIKEVDLGLDKENVLLKGGKSKVKLPYLGKDEFLFEEPENEKWELMLDLNDTLLEGFRFCLVTSSNDATMSAFMGVTVKGGTGVYLYSTDGDGLSRYKLSDKDSVNVQRTMPTTFCEAVLRIAEKTGCTTGQVYVNEEWVVAELSNDYRVYGRILTPEQVLNFEKQISKSLPSMPAFVEIPEELAAALNRARIFADPESKSTHLKVDGTRLHIFTETHMGVASDHVKIDKGHAEIEANVAAKLIIRALDVCDEFSVLDNCTAYRKGEEFLLIYANYEDA